MERKSLGLDAVSLKFNDAKSGVFSGYASKFGGVDSYGDTIIKGAYVKTITDRKRPIAMRWNHYGPVIGKWTSIVEDENGLFVEGELTQGHSVASDVYASLKHGAVTGMSIGYRAVNQKENATGGVDLYEIDLIEISVVESPADLSAQIGDVKSVIDEAKSLKEVEKLLRDAGNFSRADATALVARIKSISHGERDEAKSTSDIISAIHAATNKLTARK